ncbi:MAG: hypothetical protein VX519_06630, partial [Myxococcota bacterium]|nr:hypothetical protein [Myxococcota bacterium]
MSGIKRVFVVPIGKPVAPFGDLPGQTFVLGRTLEALQKEAIEEAGLEWVDTVPEAEPYVVISDRTWITSATLRALVKQAKPPARLQVTDPTWLATAAALQDLPEPGIYEVGLVPAGQAPDLDALPPVSIDLNVEAREAPKEHPALAHAMPETLPFTDAGVQQIEHWSHILRANWLGLSCTIAREVRGFGQEPIWRKIWRLIVVLFKARSLKPHRLARAVSHVGAGSRIHPTAVIEASVLGENVEVGPFAVIRGSLIGDGSRIEEHGVVNASVLGEGARVGKGGIANLSVLYPGAFVSPGNGFQASVFGVDSFVAWGVTIFDISFARPIRVQHQGERVSTESWFLGAAVGHRARLG